MRTGYVYAIWVNDVRPYVGSCWDINKRKLNHKSSCYNENDPSHNYQIYRYIRENTDSWDEVSFEVLVKREFKDLEQRLRLEDAFFEAFKPICNELKPYITDYDKKQYHKQYREENKEKLKQYNAKHDAIRSATIVHCQMCGKTYKGLQHKAHHERSQYHKSHI